MEGEEETLAAIFFCVLGFFFFPFSPNAGEQEEKRNSKSSLYHLAMGKREGEVPSDGQEEPGGRTSDVHTRALLQPPPATASQATAGGR